MPGGSAAEQWVRRVVAAPPPVRPRGARPRVARPRGAHPPGARRPSYDRRAPGARRRGRSRGPGRRGDLEVVVVGRGGTGEHPGVLGAAAAGGVDDQLALGQRDPRQPAGQHPHARAVVDGEGPQVDVARPELAVDERRHRGELHDRLGDPGAGVGQDLAAQLVELGARGPRPDHDPLAAGPVDRLEHQLVETVQDLLARLGVTDPPGVDVAEQRLLVEVVADDVGHVGVDELVVGDAVADRVGQRHVAGPRGVDDAGAAQHGVGPEVHRVEELVVDAAVDHVHRRHALGGPHHHPAAAALEVAPLDELDAHRAREQRVLEVGTVVDARRQHHHRRVDDTGGGGGAQRGQQVLRVARDRPDPVGAHGLGQRGGDRPAVGHHVGDPRRHAGVVLEHPELTGVVTDQVDAGDVHAHAVGGADRRGLAVVVRGGGDHAAGDHAVVEDLARVVDVGEEHLQRLHALLDAVLDRRPGVHLDDARQDVEREGPLLATDVEGHALVEVARLQRLDPAHQLGRGQGLQGAAQPEVRRAQVAAVEHLVVGGTLRVVPLEHGRHCPNLQKPPRAAAATSPAGPRPRVVSGP